MTTALIAIAATSIALDARAAADTTADDLALIEFLGNTGETKSRTREPDALWLLDELAQTETTPSAPARSRAERLKETKP